TEKGRRRLEDSGRPVAVGALVTPRILVGAAIGLSVLLVASLLLRTPSDREERRQPDLAGTIAPRNEWAGFLDEHFAGDDACRECHTEQFEAHQRSGHSRTATPMQLSKLAARLDGSTFRDSRRDQRFRFTRNNDLF